MADRPASRFYDTDPRDPDAPVVLPEYHGRHHGLIRPGDTVAYENPAWQQPDGSYRTAGMDGPLVIDEIIDLGGGHVTAVLNDGEWEVAADNLRWTGGLDGVRRQDIPGAAIIWSWPGTSSFIRHEVRCLTAPADDRHGRRLASAGTVLHTIWAGDEPSADSRSDEGAGEAFAVDLISRMRRYHADDLAANRFLLERGYDPDQHAAGRDDCNCLACPAGRKAVAARDARRHARKGAGR